MDDIFAHLNVKLKEPQCIIIPNDIVEECSKFAEKVNETTMYADCGQTNNKKKIFDNFVGKLGEFAVYKLLSSINKDYYSINEPDINIYEGAKKNWDSDLYLKKGEDKISIAVKSQDVSQAKIYGFSGTFQNSSSRKDKAIYNKNELVFLCLHFSENKKVHKVLVMPPKKISEISFLAPKEVRLADSKICYYAYNNFNTTNLKKWLKKLSIDEKIIYGNSSEQNVYIKVDKDVVAKLNGVDLNNKVKELMKSLF